MSDLTSRRQVLMYMLAPAALAPLVGCAAVSAETGRQELIQRAKDYWEHMRANDRLSAWKYEAASKDKSLTLEGYLKRGGIVYESVDVRSVLRLEGDEAELDVKLRYAVPAVRLKGQDAAVRDRWTRVDGEWLHVLPRNPLFGTAA